MSKDREEKVYFDFGDIRVKLAWEKGFRTSLPFYISIKSASTSKGQGLISYSMFEEAADYIIFQVKDAARDFDTKRQRYNNENEIFYAFHFPDQSFIRHPLSWISDLCTAIFSEAGTTKGREFFNILEARIKEIGPEVEALIRPAEITSRPEPPSQEHQERIARSRQENQEIREGIKQMLADHGINNEELLGALVDYVSCISRRSR